MQTPTSSRAFTLIELMLAIAIAIAITVISIPNVRGFAAEKRLHGTFEKFDGLARKAQLNAVSQQRSWSMSWEENRIVLRPDNTTPEESEGDGAAQVEELPILEGESYRLDRHASLVAPRDTPPVWTFWRSGTCEPVIVGYTGPEGSWSAQYNPLTGHGEIIDQVTR